VLVGPLNPAHRDQGGGCDDDHERDARSGRAHDRSAKPASKRLVAGYRDLLGRLGEGIVAGPTPHLLEVELALIGLPKHPGEDVRASWWMTTPQPTSWTSFAVSLSFSTAAITGRPRRGFRRPGLGTT